MKISELKTALERGKFDRALTGLYGEARKAAQTKRFAAAADAFIALYGDLDGDFYSVPGRSEISGNHTDHNHGRVIAAAIDLDIIAVAAKTEDGEIRIKSEGFDEDRVDVSGELKPGTYKSYGSAAIIAGMCDGYAKRGYRYGGMRAYTTSDVLKGSGLSSSAAFEVMVGNLLNYMYNDGRIDAPTIAKTAQYAENVFFGKPCGLMDQTACAVGGFVAIDFLDPASPVIEKLAFDLSGAGYSLCIVNTGGNHANLNDDYASVPAEMKAVAQQFGRPVLRGLTSDDIMSRLPELREKCGDRAVLRALHFISENDRVLAQTTQLRRGDLDAFLSNVIASGNSSYMKLQNVYTVKNVSEQGLSLALAIAEMTLGKTARKSAWRVHGGGFAGTIQAFVPNEDVDRFRENEEKVFGAGSCITLQVRGTGATRIGL